LRTAGHWLLGNRRAGRYHSRDMSDFVDRFGGVARLLGAGALERLRAAHVCVVGLGGVGSWAVEALARSGVGHLTLVDQDDVCVSNINRQLPALSSTIGRPKAAVLAARVADINPAAQVHAREEFFTAATAGDLLAPRFDAVLDAIDSPSLKARLIAGCRARGRPVVCVGGAGGRRDPTQIRVADLAFTSRDPLLAGVRGHLRRDHGFPRGDAPFGVDCVFSTEPLIYPESSTEGAPAAAEAAGGSACERRFGALCFVTGAFGFVAAAQVAAKLAGLPGLAPPRRAAGQRGG
jgi:tRNA A37 threonylcarbamoyladenosine dehydratase